MQARLAITRFNQSIFVKQPIQSKLEHWQSNKYTPDPYYSLTITTDTGDITLYANSLDDLRSLLQMPATVEHS